MKMGLINLILFCLLTPGLASADNSRATQLEFVDKWLCFVSEDQVVRDLYYFMPNGRFLTSNETMKLDLFKILALKNEWRFDAQSNTVVTYLSLTTDSSSSSGPLIQSMSLKNGRLTYVEDGMTKVLSDEACEILR